MNFFPSEFYRGISSPSYVTPEEYLLAGAFQFDSYDPKRGDEYCELSINWNDEKEALTTLLEQHKPTKREDKQFKVGYCVINRTMLDLFFKAYIDDNNFSYERRPVAPAEENDFQANPYHGNLLIKEGINKNIKKNIQHGLATLAGRVIRRENDEKTEAKCTDSNLTQM